MVAASNIDGTLAGGILLGLLTILIAAMLVAFHDGGPDDDGV